MARKRLNYVLRGRECNTIMHPYKSRDGEWWEAPYCLKHHKWLLDCLQCGNEFHTDRPHTKWCSARCRQQAYRMRKLEVVTS